MGKSIVELSSRIICVLHYDEDVSGITKQKVDEYLEYITTVVGYKKNDKLFRYKPYFTRYEFIPQRMPDDKKMEWPHLTMGEFNAIEREKKRIENMVRNRTITFDRYAQDFYS